MSNAKPSRAEKRETARRAILDAAAVQFSHLGFEGASMNVIAEKSGISKQNIVYYFSSKKELWKATVADVFEHVNLEFERKRETVSSAHTLNGLIATYYDIARRYPAYVLIPMLEGINDTWRSELLAKSYLAPHIQAFEGTVAALVASGEIKDQDPLHLQNLVTGGAQLFLALAPLWSHAIATDTASEAFLSAYAKSVTDLLSQ